MMTVQLACEAMATRFELVLSGPREAALRAAGEEAMGEIHRLEAALSLYRPDSQISEVNRGAALRPVRVTPEVFGLLRHALQLSEVTGGAFDITVAPLLRAWGLMRGTGRMPDPGALAEARLVVGFRHVHLDARAGTVAFDREGVMLDLGSIGKGYALDRAADLLREAGVERGLIHGGTSTAVALGRTGDGEPWKVAVTAPETADGPGSMAGGRPLSVVELEDESLSVSAVWGKGFEAEGRYFGHVMDPSRGEPVSGALLAAIVLPSATESDALSTALLVRGEEMVERLRGGGVSVRCLVVLPAPGGTGYRVVSSGMESSVS